MLTLVDVDGHPPDRLVRLAADGALGLVQLCRHRPGLAHRLGPVVHQPPDARQEAEAALEPGVGPLDLVFRRRDEHHVQPQGVRAYFWIIGSGSTTLPFDFDMTLPSFSTIPCVSSCVNGSSWSTMPRSRNTRVKNRE